MGSTRRTTNSASSLAGGGEGRSGSRIPAAGGGILNLRYPGGKGAAGLAEWICERLPAHVFYAEPFAGKGGVFRQKPPALRSWLVDCEIDVVEWWERLAPPGTIASVGDGVRFCELAAEWGPGDLLLYVDPPYLLSTRSRKRCYRNELSASDHVRLLDALLACRCAVAVSGYWSDLYADRLQRWEFYTRPVITRGGVLRDECLWVNCKPTRSLAVSYSELGGDYRERERVAKKIRRWRDAVMAMPPRERDAVLRACLAAAGGVGRTRRPPRRR